MKKYKFKGKKLFLTENFDSKEETYGIYIVNFNIFSLKIHFSELFQIKASMSANIYIIILNSYAIK